MLAYSIIDHNQEMGSSAEGVNDEKNTHDSLPVQKYIVKQYKSHHCAADLDAGFMNIIVDKMRDQQYDDRELSSSVITNNDHG
jgi:hypothetical protein